jgi:hypothetical protein
MNCQNLIAQLGFRCREIGEGALRVWSPFTYGKDGQRIGLYVEQTPQGYLVTDNAESFMHASNMGANLTPARFNAVRNAVGHSVQISAGGVISAFVSEEKLPLALADVLNASLAVSHYEYAWTPRSKSESFTAAVSDVLERAVGNRIRRNVQVIGASGHQLELPLAIALADQLVYIQPIATNQDNKVDWKSVYAGYGRMTDLKGAGAADTARVIVLEDASNEDEFAKAATLLSHSASVVPFKNLREWAVRYA